jgi:predicted O-methyltransferase YrrM
MDKSHPRFMDRLENGEAQGFSYKKTSIPTQEGEFLWSQVREHQYTTTLEIGCALGISSLYICDALSGFEEKSHTIIDPYQTTEWKSIGVMNLKKLGFNFFTLIEESSEIALPQLLKQEATFDFAFIDGWHTFDHTLIDFFYLNRLVRVGGMIVFDDVRYQSVSRVIRYVAKYPNYSIITDEHALQPEGKKARLLKMSIKGGYYLCKLFPSSIRHLFFSDNILSEHPINEVLLHRPRWIALYKTDEDHREFNWYEDF